MLSKITNKTLDRDVKPSSFLPASRRLLQWVPRVPSALYLYSRTPRSHGQSLNSFRSVHWSRGVPWPFSRSFWTKKNVQRRHDDKQDETKIHVVGFYFTFSTRDHLSVVFPPPPTSASSSQSTTPRRRLPRRLTASVCLSSPQTLRPQKTRPPSLWAPWRPRRGWGGLRAPIEDPPVRPSHTHTGSVLICLPISHVLTHLKRVHCCVHRDDLLLKCSLEVKFLI